MKLLIDTHTALWLFNDHENLSQTARNCLLNEENELYISIASAWEIAIKHSLGKLTEFPDGVELFLSEVYDCPMDIVDIQPKYVMMVEKLPYLHQDPFDRIIVATALCEDMAVLTIDENIRKYDVKCIW
ncbi:MAG: type II toxin-antitoxin system VapC family toxin [Lachnospiraceae bacterium]|jgi:PIN domain nuclease of toxin-antitoxin system|nr:type II toxin-antitoxin system VapC family toxin [Lachnospiraceae bacterium]